MSRESPLNPLERSLEQAQAGLIPIADFVRRLVGSDLFVPSGAEISANGEGFQPVLFEKEGVRMITCFTSQARVGTFSELAPYMLKIRGSEFMRRMPENCGLVINPGEKLGLEMSPQGVRNTLRDFLETK